MSLSPTEIKNCDTSPFSDGPWAITGQRPLGMIVPSCFLQVQVQVLDLESCPIGYVISIILKVAASPSLGSYSSKRPVGRQGQGLNAGPCIRKPMSSSFCPVWSLTGEGRSFMFSKSFPVPIPWAL